MRMILAAALAAVLAACGDPQTTDSTSAPVGEAAADVSASDPAAAVRPIYDFYIAQSEGRERVQPAYEAPHSAALTAAWAAFNERTDDEEMGGALGFDPYINAQDWTFRSVDVSVVTPPANGRSVVLARFTDFGRTNEILYDMVLENGAWKIDNVRASHPELGVMNLRDILEGNE